MKDQESFSRYHLSEVEYFFEDLKVIIEKNNYDEFKQKFYDLMFMIEKSFTTIETDYDNFVENLSTLWDDIDIDLAKAYLEGHRM